MASAFAAEGAAVAIVDLPDSPGAEVAGEINEAGGPGEALFAPVTWPTWPRPGN